MLYLNPQAECGTMEEMVIDESCLYFSTHFHGQCQRGEEKENKKKKKGK